MTEPEQPASEPSVDEMPVDPHEGQRVCVTGASGYIASHLVRLLLERGYRVRATVRNAEDETKTAHLRELATASRHPLELFSADLLEPGSYDDAIQDCVGVFHTASPVLIVADDPQREIVDPAVRGTRNVLQSCRRAKTVKRVVVTSSVAAVAFSDRSSSRVFTEADWNDHASMKQPYMVAKTHAERAAWDFQKKLPDEERFDLVAMNPAFVYGPLLSALHRKSSPALVLRLLRRSLPACPRLYFAIVDVRDVALAHVLAFERPEASGRYLLCNGGRWMQEMAKLLAGEFPDYPVPTGRLPNLLMYAAALLDKTVSFEYVRRNLGRATRFDGSRAPAELGFDYRPVDQTLVDTAQSFIDLGLARPKKGR